MKASELRIGNFIGWYEPKHEILPVKVNGIVGKMIYAQVNCTFQQCHENYQSFKPIPLTEEWLLKFGLFKLIDNRDKWYCEDKGVFSFHGKIHSSDYFISTNDFKIFHLCIATLDDGMESWEYLTELKYVHQLQNLYFALTNEELTYENLP